MTKKPDPSPTPDDLAGAWRQVESFRGSTADGGGEFIRELCSIAVEEPVILDIHGLDRYILHCTPREYRALAVGFLFTSGTIQTLGDIADLQERPGSPSIVDIHLSPERLNRLQAKNNKCRESGGAEEIFPQIDPAGDGFRIPASRLKQVAETLERKQRIFPHTGGTHAAGLFQADGEFLSFAEDVTRHSALDKTIGKYRMSGASTAGLGVMLSGRVNIEMLTKCARVGLELIAAVSAPTSSALEAAEKCNITVCGFVRGNRATAFTHPRRIIV
jgi:FdhD protein